MSPAIVHEATVVSCPGQGIVVVYICPDVSDACSGCAMSASCKSVGRSGERIELKAIAGKFSSSLNPGAKVLVSPLSGATSHAATLLMTLPLAGLLAGAITASAAGCADGLTAAAALTGAAAGLIPAAASGSRSKTRWRVTGLVPQQQDKT